LGHGLGAEISPPDSPERSKAVRARVVHNRTFALHPMMTSYARRVGFAEELDFTHAPISE
jgi:hypothetical protein